MLHLHLRLTGPNGGHIALFASAASTNFGSAMAECRFSVINYRVRNVVPLLRYSRR